MKAIHFGGAEAPLHASDLRPPTNEQGHRGLIPSSNFVLRVIVTANRPKTWFSKNWPSDTGQEKFADPKFPVFGMGGCAILAAAIDQNLRQPWRGRNARGRPESCRTRA